ncbi:MAG: D-alanyl-D-alanine carboxypeptidase, partial [Nocardioides sp.]
MGRRDRRHGRRRAGGAFWRWFPVVLVLAILASAVAAWRFDLGERWLGTGPDPQTEPAAVEPPPGLELPEMPVPVAVADPLTGTGHAVRAEVRRALAPYLRDRDLGRRVHAAVAGLDGPAEVFSTGSGTTMPASTTKLLTTTAALAALGPDHVFETRVVSAGRRIVLVGGGDPLLAGRKAAGNTWPERADVATLARATARQLRQHGRRTVRLAYDDTLFSGPAENPHWRADYVPDGIVSPITALWVDEGRDPDGLGRVRDPSATAAATFAAALE